MARTATLKSVPLDNKDKRISDFKRLANKRVNNALKQIELVGNLSNRITYAYDEAQVKLIFKALQNKLDEAKAKFQAPGTSGNAAFTLD